MPVSVNLWCYQKVTKVPQNIPLIAAPPVVTEHIVIHSEA